MKDRALGNNAKAPGLGIQGVRNRAVNVLKDAVQGIPRKKPTAKERSRDLAEFYERYEELVEILCDAAQYGPIASLQDRYQRRRAQIEADYPALKPFVRAYLERLPEDRTLAERRGDGQADAFELLFAATDLAEFLEHDDGFMISRISRTREALTLYGEHLRQLMSKS